MDTGPEPLETRFARAYRRWEAENGPRTAVEQWQQGYTVTLTLREAQEYLCLRGLTQLTTELRQTGGKATRGKPKQSAFERKVQALQVWATSIAPAYAPPRWEDGLAAELGVTARTARQYMAMIREAWTEGVARAEKSRRALRFSPEEVAAAETRLRQHLLKPPVVSPENSLQER